MPSKKIISRFKKNEEFDFLSVPKHFYSVTDGSIHRVRSYCLKSIRSKYGRKNYEPGALTAMLNSISGEFTPLYNQLEGDYNTRRSNLQMAYNNGLAEIKKEISDIDIIVNDYRRALEEYSESLKKATGRKIDEELIFDKRPLENIKNEVNKMMERQKND